MKPIRIVIIAKAPVPGLAKTRLIPALGAQGAALLARRMLQHSVQAALDAQVGTVELCVTPGPQAYDWASLCLPAGVHWSDQGDGDLGARMDRAAQRVTEAGEAVVLIGSDCPGLDIAQLQAAAAALRTHDACITPAADGGYVLLGLNRHHPTLFENMVWSTPTVADETLRRLAQLAWRVSTHAMLHDIDEPQDLPCLPAHFRAGLPHLALGAA